MVFTNLNIYLAIAEEAADQAEKLYSEGRVSKPDGQPGFIISYDPTQKII